MSQLTGHLGLNMMSEEVGSNPTGGAVNGSKDVQEKGNDVQRTIDP